MSVMQFQFAVVEIRDEIRKTCVCFLKMISQNRERNEMTSRNPSDFSIEHILNRAGSRFPKTNSCFSENTPNEHHSATFSWLQCTRFCPPRITRKLFVL